MHPVQLSIGFSTHRGSLVYHLKIARDCRVIIEKVTKDRVEVEKLISEWHDLAEGIPVVK